MIMVFISQPGLSVVYAILQVIPALFHSKHPQRMWIQWGGIFIKVHSWDHLGFTTVYS